MARPTGVVSIADNLPTASPDVAGTAVNAADGGYPAESPAAAPQPPVTTEAPSAEPAPAEPKVLSLGELADKAVPAADPAPSIAVDPAAPNAETTESVEVSEIREVVAEKLGKGLTIDAVKKTEISGNSVLDMSTAQRAAYDREVSEVQEKIKGSERAYVLAQWYVGQCAIKLQRDSKEHGGSTYGQATVEGFAHDIGRDKSTVYKSMKMAKALTFNHAQSLTISVEAFQVIQKAPDKIRDWVLDEIVKRCKAGQVFGTDQIERVVETLTWYPSITAQGDKPAEVQKALDALIAWDPKPLPGKDKPTFDLDAAKKSISAAAPELLPVVKGDEKSAVKAEKAKREQPGLNSSTGTSHIGVAKSFAKALSTIIEKAGSLTISIKEAGGDGEMTEKAYDNFAEHIQNIANDVDNAIEILQAIKASADEILEVEEEPAKPASKKKKAKKRSKK